MTMFNTFNRVCCSVVAVCLVFTVIQPVSALPDEHKKAIDRDSVHYALPSETSADGSQCSENIVLSGKNNESKAFNFLVTQGLTPDQAAGIVGNLYGESQVFPRRKQNMPTSYEATIADIKEGIRLNKADPTQGFGIGIAQWTSWNRQQGLLDFAEAKKGDPLSLEIQLQFLLKELDSNGLQEIKKSKDVRQATWIFLVFFERPAATSGYEYKVEQATSGSAKETLDLRTSYANNVLKGGNGSDAGSATSSGSSCDGTTALTGDESEPSFKANPKVKVDEPPSGNFTESLCTDGFTTGAQSLSNFVKDKYSPPVSSIGGFDCRQNTASPGVSVHGVGRALDIMIDGTTKEGKETGDRIRNFMINNAQALGVQRVIWDRHIWSANIDGWRDYTGPNPHTDHLHVEINLKASDNPNLAGGV